MSHKHLACVLVGMLVFLQAYVFFMVNGRAMTMKQEAASAQTAAEGASMQVRTQTIALTARKDKTEGQRQWVREWDPYLSQTPNAEKAQTMIDERIAQVNLFRTRRTQAEIPITNGGFIPKYYSDTEFFEDDYHRSLQWLGDLEQGLAASRVSSLSLTKGQGPSVAMNVTIDLPMIDAAALPGAAQPAAK